MAQKLVLVAAVLQYLLLTAVNGHNFNPAGVSEQTCVDGELTAHEEDCQLFYLCADATRRLQSCPNGLHFNPIDRICDWPADEKCSITATEQTCVDGELIAHEGNCQLFYLCADATRRLLSCPNGLHFNPIDRICDWPADDKCSITVTEQTCVDGELTAHEEDCQLFYLCTDATRRLHSCPNGLHFNPIDRICDWPADEKCSITVTEQTCVDGELIAHEEDCQLFYLCADATRRLHSCPNGLHFNPIDRICDWPADEKCSITVTEQTCVDGELIAHEEDCQLFYLCADATRRLHSCPNGLHFNPIDRICDWPAEEKCSITVTEQTCVEGELIAHEENCQLFYLCADATRRLHSCPNGLHFNPIDRICDWPADEKCSITVTEQTCVEGELIAHEEDCQLFYLCADATRHLFSCPNGLHFNPVEQICDWSANEKCTV